MTNAETVLSQTLTRALKIKKSTRRKTVIVELSESNYVDLYGIRQNMELYTQITFQTKDKLTDFKLCNPFFMNKTGLQPISRPV